jgi:serine/threonine protein kinase
MMVLCFCKRGSLRNYYLNKLKEDSTTLYTLSRIARGLLDIHNAEKVHKDLHLGNILYGTDVYVSDLGMCQPANEFMEYYLI